jgi:uncharacterized protein
MPSCMPKPTRLFFVADLHGSERCFRKFLNAAATYRADVLLIGGDIAAKTITPLFSRNGTWSGRFHGSERTARSSDELAGFETDLRAMGTIPYRTTTQEWADATSNRGRADNLFRQLALQELAGWLTLATQRLRGKGVRTLIGLGNDDLNEMEPILAASDYVELTDQKILRVDAHHELLTLPFSNPTPWRTNRELSEEEIGRRIETLALKLEHPEQSILNAHVPPLNTPLDLAPRLDASLGPVMNAGGEPELAHVGSSAVRSAIERLQPLVGLHGHIHESKGLTSIGPTLCLNPGSAYPEGVLQGAVLDLEADRVRSYVLTTG